MNTPATNSMTTNTRYNYTTISLLAAV